MSSADPQNYLVVPDQPWLDGYCVERGIIRQFVAMPLGEGYTAEERLTGAAKHGGLQGIGPPNEARDLRGIVRGPVQGGGRDRRHVLQPGPPETCHGPGPRWPNAPYDGDREAISGSETLAGLKSVARTGRETGESQFAEV
ncbi:MAG: hypothetical protein F4123_09440 [Gemmatimonadetes bacterium]|nr:hypothetical protein [Gemmatimonadota bacterium]MYI46579.1 hypothetical protein [Gemmatimonadota bacterium]